MDRAKPPIGDSLTTERVNPNTLDLDQLGSRELLSRLLDEDRAVPPAVSAALAELTRACDALHRTLADGGRWFNVGAGTSGRIGVLDAAEIPPTFGLPEDRVRALIAGGDAALRRAVEGAEDDSRAAADELAAEAFCAQDAVVGISASGGTPYVLGAIEHARELGAVTIGITCNAESALVRVVEIAIVAEVGPEAIAGSTRMKGGLAQKAILNSLSTAVMVRLGRVCGNRMVEVQLSNAKLRERAVRLLMDLASVPRSVAETALETAGSVSGALERLR
jgi:N-acetylmuramic acid 6-phosphate etherase